MRKTYKTITISFGVFLGIIFLCCLLKEPSEISLSERRPLQQFPTIKKETLLNGEFMNDFDSYTVDQFPFREGFRKLYSFVVKDVFKQTDIEGLYEKNDYIIAKEYPLQESSIKHATKVFQNICNTCLSKENNVYLSIIPDKAFYLQNDKKYLTMNYMDMVNQFQKQNPNIKYIDILNKLELKDYYKTDPHWKQESIISVAETLNKEMGATISKKYTTKEIDKDFYGTYAGQYAKKLKADKIKYLTSKEIEELKVFDHQNNKEGFVYDFDKLKDKDMYEFYLSGPLSYITIKNPNARTEKELIIFRDSFASPLAPILATGYKKVTLLDVRYLPSSSIKNFIEFKNQDILFLYSSSVLNHSETLK